MLGGLGRLRNIWRGREKDIYIEGENMSEQLAAIHERRCSLTSWTCLVHLGVGGEHRRGWLEVFRMGAYSASVRCESGDEEDGDGRGLRLS